MTRNRIPLSPRRLLGAASVLALSVVLPASAGEEARAFNIPAQPLSEAVMEFARQSNLNVVAPAHLTRGKTSRAISGEMDPRDALRLLMSDAPIDVRSGNNGAIILVQAVTDVPKPQTAPAAPPAPLPATPRDPAGTADSQPARSAPLQRTDNREDEERTLGRVTVTGTLIRGLAPESSPLQVYSRDDILNSGAANTEQFIRSIPQNFGGGSSDQVSAGLPNDANSRENSTLGTSANLRGLGSRGTLVMLNGNRLAPASSIGDFVDLSLIPISALERVDVLTDGASSIYGGDAIAGVINFVLRDDFEGAETSIRVGSVTKGNMNEFRIGQTLGTSWGSGNILGVLEYSERDSLKLVDRPDIPFPLRANGQPLAMLEEYDLLPSSAKQSVMLALNQTIGSSVKLNATALYADRDSRSSRSLPAVSGGFNIVDVNTEIASVSAGIDFDFTPNWNATIGATWSELKNSNVQLSCGETACAPGADVEPPTTGRSSLRSADILLNGLLFSLPAGDVRIALGTHIREEEFARTSGVTGLRLREADRNVTALYAEAVIPVVGPEIALPGVERLELNLSGRIENYSDFGTTRDPKIGLLWAPFEDLKFRGSYSTSFAPPPLGRVGAIDRGATVNRYDIIRANLGIPLPDASLEGGNILIALGTAANLEPETSRTYSAGFDYQREWGGSRWTIGTTYYDIAFEGRLGATPLPGNLNPNWAPSLAWSDPASLPAGTVIFFPTEQEIQSVLATLQRSVNFANGATLDDIRIVSNALVVRNLQSTETRGLDLDTRYSFNLRNTQIQIGFNANYIIEFTERASDTSPTVSTINSLYAPVDLRLRGTIGASRGGASGFLHVNHANRYRTDQSATGRPVGEFTTADLTLNYRFESSEGWLNNSSLSFSVLNLFDRAPPRTPVTANFYIAGYDPANATPLGRFVALELRKAF